MHAGSSPREKKERMNKAFQKIQLSLLMALVLSAALFRSGSAQAVTTLSVSPSETVIGVGGQAALSVLVSDAVNLNAFDIELIYDPQVLTLSTWGFGNFLSQLAQVVLENEPGRFHLVATQLAQPGKTGSGSLIELRFTGLQAGESAITLTRGELAEPEGALSYPVRNPGVVRVSSALTASPTQTPTQTPTPTSGVLPPVVNPTNTPTAGGGAPTQQATPWGGEQSPNPRNTLALTPEEVRTEAWVGTLALEQPAEALVLAPGAEKTRKAGHNATLMAQVAQMTASSAGLSASGARQAESPLSEVLLGAVLAAGVVLLGLLAAQLIRRKNIPKQEGIDEE